MCYCQGSFGISGVTTVYILTFSNKTQHTELHWVCLLLLVVVLYIKCIWKCGYFFPLWFLLLVLEFEFEVISETRAWKTFILFVVFNRNRDCCVLIMNKWYAVILLVCCLLKLLVSSIWLLSVELCFSEIASFLLKLEIVFLSNFQECFNFDEMNIALVMRMIFPLEEMRGAGSKYQSDSFASFWTPLCGLIIFLSFLAQNKWFTWGK